MTTADAPAPDPDQVRPLARARRHPDGGWAGRRAQSGRGRARDETDLPGERARPAGTRLVLAWLLAFTLPLLVTTALLPTRPDHAQVIALVFVVPVVVVAVLGATWPAIASAVFGSALFGVLFTEPYGELAVANPDEVITTIALLVVALLVGVLCSRLVQQRARDEGRRNELRHLLLFSRAASSATEQRALADEACVHLAAVLHAEGCRWRPGRRTGGAPVLLGDGEIMAHLDALNPDRAKLPRGLEVPARFNRVELGQFVVVTDESAVVSAEERYTAASIAALFARTALQLP